MNDELARWRIGPDFPIAVRQLTPLGFNGFKREFTLETIERMAHNAMSIMRTEGTPCCSQNIAAC